MVTFELGIIAQIILMSSFFHIIEFMSSQLDTSFFSVENLVCLPWFDVFMGKFNTNNNGLFIGWNEINRI